MQKQIVIMGVAILLFIGLSGCNEVSNTIHPENNKFVGTWSGTVPALGIDEISIQLFSNSTFTIGTLCGAWNIEDDKLVLTFDDGGLLVYLYIFSNNDKTLTVTDIDTEVTSELTKQ